MMQDEAGEGFQAQLSIALVRVAHMPVGSDQARHRVEELRGWHQLVHKVVHIDPYGSEYLCALRVAARHG
jgi:hypothetical protein